MDQPTNGHSQALLPPMANYIPPLAPAIGMPYPQQQQPPQTQFFAPSEQPSLIQYTPATANSSETEGAASNLSVLQQQQQQMAAMMQMQQQQQWAAAAAAGGFASPYMMPYAAGQMMMMPPQPGMERPASRQSSRPQSRQSNAAPVSSARSMTNGQTGAGGQASAMLPNQGYPNYLPPGMYNPWFDPYWQSMYGGYQHPYSYGYSDEMLKYWRQGTQGEEDRYSHHSAAHSQSKQSQHSSSIQTWGSMDSLNADFYQNHNPMLNGYYPTKQPSAANQVKRPTKTTNDPNTLLTIAPVSNQQPASSAAKRKDAAAPENGAGAEEEEDDEDEDEDEDDDDDEDGSEEESDDGSSDRFSIKSDLAQVNEESSKARRTPLLFIRPHLRARFAFNQLLQVLPQSPSDTNQPATVEILSADSLHLMAPSLVEERQLLTDFIGPLTSSTAKSNVTRYCERQSQLAHKSLQIIDRDALSLLWQYMALLVKTNGVIDVRVDIPKILWSSSSSSLVDAASADTHSIASNSSSTGLENSLREFLALGEIDTSIKFACENQLHTHALIISYLTDKNLFQRTMNNIISNLDNGDVLKTFYELGAGSTPSVVTNVTKAHYGDWKRHLAVILANRTDANAEFVDLCVKTMGDTLVTSGRIYAGHFCYLIANVPFGSYRNNADKLAVLGSLHAGHSSLAFASIPNLQLTEVYEYALKKCLTSFIPLKIYYTSKLVTHGLKREALAYCEEIGQTLMRQGNVAYVQLVDLQLFLLIAEKSRAFSRNFQLDPTSYKEATWLVELRRTIQSLINNAFLNKTVRDESFNHSYQQPPPAPVKSEQNKSRQPTRLSNHIEKSSDHIGRPLEQPVPAAATVPSSTNSYLPVANTHIPNGYDLSNPIPTEQSSYPNAATNNYPNNLTVDTAIPYAAPVPSNYYQPPVQSRYYPNDPQPAEANNHSQQWGQPMLNAIPSDPLNSLSQIPSINGSYSQTLGDQTSYTQPGFTSTPNPYPSSQQQQQWNAQGSVDRQDRLSTGEPPAASDLMTRRASIITFNEPPVPPAVNWVPPPPSLMVDARKASTSSTHSNPSSLSPKMTSGAASFVYQAPQLMRYPTNPSSSIAEDQTSQPKKKHSIFDDGDDVFSTNPQKSSDSKASATAAANPAAPGAPKTGLMGRLMANFGLKRPTQAHLPDDKNKTLKFDAQTGRWIDTSKSADEQASTAVQPPPKMPSSIPSASSSLTNNPTQPPSFNPSMPPGSTQPRTLSFAAGATTAATANSSAPAPQINPPTWSSHVNASSANTATQPAAPIPAPAAQPSQRQPSAAQQRLQALRQQHATAAQQAQAPPGNAPNQFSLRNRATQSRYVDVIASGQGAVPNNANAALNELMPIPSTTMPTLATNSNYFVPGSQPSTTGSHDQSSS